MIREVTHTVVIFVDVIIKPKSFFWQRKLGDFYDQNDHEVIPNHSQVFF